MLDEGVGDAEAVESIIKESWGMSQGPLRWLTALAST